ncbi:hypothetical protein WCE00_01845 [Acinetobacter haemolyticus]|uniref:hypothetical protein n=1 Tax=Acinetobacter haemolyticus TaxID=29430 RepID=UPI0034D3E5B6
MIIYVALFIASLVISQALQPKPQKPKSAAFQDFDFPTIEDGTPQIVVFGDVWLKDWTVLGTGNFKTRAIITKQKGLFGSKKTTTGYKYYMGIHMGICRGIDELIEVKVGEKTAWTGTVGGSLVSSINIRNSNLFGGDKGEGGIDGTLTLLGGDQDQQISGLLTNLYKTLDIPAFRNVVTFFYDGHICSNSPYPKPWAFRVRRISNDWDGSVWYPSKAAIMLENNTIRAMNPAHILYEAFTNRVWGRGFAASQLDLTSFQAAADKLFEEQFGMCLAWKRQESLQEFIQQVLDVIGAALFIDRTTGLWRLTLLRDDYDVSTLTIYNSGNGLLRIESDDNAANDIATNQLIVTYRDPITNSDKTIRDENIASIQKYGVISENKSYAGIPTASLAARLAARDLKPSQAGIKKFKLVFDRRAYTLQPMSVFKVSSPERGIDSIVLRAIRVEHNNITNGEITVTAIQDVFGLPATSYIKDQPSLWQPPVSTALNITNPLIYEIPFYELVEDFSVTDLQLKNNQGYFAVVAQQPTPLHISFDLLAKASTETSYINSGTSDFAFISSIASSIPQTASAVTCVLNDLIENVEIGDRALLGSEIVRVTAIDINLNSVTLARGCIDTLPVSHAAGTKFYIYSNLNNAINRLFSMNQTANFKFITSTSSDELDENLATAYTAILSNRLSRPYPPANVRLNNAFFPVSTDVSNGLSISWQPRNRLTQVALAPSFLDASTASEDNSTYNIRIYDANNVQLLDRQNVESPYIWNVPRRFIGDLETTLHIPMTGTNNSRNFSDISANAHTVANDGVIIKTDTAANGGSAAFFDTLMMQSSAHWSLSAVEDHALEARVKTPTANLTANQDGGTWVITVGAVDGISSEKYNINFLYNFTLGTMKLGIQGNYLNPVGNQLEEVNYSIEFSIGQNTYFDFAVEKIGDHLDIYIDGMKAGECNLSVLDAGTGSLKFIKLTAWQAKSSFMINGLRMTKRIGGRYGADYTPAAFAVGGSDPYWSNVVLLIRMLGADNSPSLTDSSVNGLTITNTATIMIKTDAAARGGSAARFCVPMLHIQNHTALRDKNFVIEFRAKFLSDNLSMTIFNLIESMRLDFLTLKNFDPTLGFTESVEFDLATNIVDGNYHGIKIERDASTGIVRFSFDDLFVDGILNATSALESDLYIGGLGFFGTYLNGFKIQTVDGTEGTEPNVNNPVRIELESQREALKSHQAFITTVTVL